MFHSFYNVGAYVWLTSGEYIRAGMDKQLSLDTLLMERLLIVISYILNFVPLLHSRKRK